MTSGQSHIIHIKNILRSDLDSPIWSDLNISDEGLGSPGDSISLDECLQDNSLDTFSSGSDSHSPGGLTPPYTPATSDRSSPPHVLTVDNSHSVLLSQNTSRNQHTTDPSNYSYQYYQPQLVPAPPLLLAPVQIQPIPVLLPPTCRTATQSKSCASRSVPTEVSSVDGQLSVKEARRIRNRESAINSRLKQKETMEQLKNQVSKLEKENTDLKQENCQLKIKLKFLEEETRKCKDLFKSTVSGDGRVSKKRTMSALAVIFIIGFNFGPLFNVLNPGGRLSSPSNDVPMPRSAQSIMESHGRALLWTPDFDNSRNLTRSKDETNETINFVGTGTNSSSFEKQSNDNSDCMQKYFNKTDSIRMENDLRGWVQRVKSQGVKKKVPSSRIFDRPSFKKPIPVARMKHLMSYNYDDAGHINLNDPVNEVFKRNMDKLLESINRRSDTFYFVSFSALDTMLLPAEANGTKTQVRPRFSLIMPSLNKVFNETDSNSGINSTFNLFSMMQIDCEVMNTKTVVVKNLVSGPGNVDSISLNVSERSRKKVTGQTNPVPKELEIKTQLNDANETRSRYHMKKDSRFVNSTSSNNSSRLL